MAGAILGTGKDEPVRPFGDTIAPPLLWRLAVILLVPVLVLCVPLIIYETVPQTAGNLHYEVRVNRFTGEACILFKGHEFPASLREFSC